MSISEYAKNAMVVRALFENTKDGKEEIETYRRQFVKEIRKHLSNLSLRQQNDRCSKNIVTIDHYHNSKSQLLKCHALYLACQEQEYDSFNMSYMGNVRPDGHPNQVCNASAYW